MDRRVMRAGVGCGRSVSVCNAEESVYMFVGKTHVISTRTTTAMLRYQM